MNLKKLLLILVGSGTFCKAQNFFELPNVSMKYNVIANIEKCGVNRCSGKATIDLYDKNTKKNYQTLVVNDFHLDLSKERKPVTDSLRNSVVFYDYNFDGNEDIAIKDEVIGKKNFFKVYLNDDDDVKKFVYHEGLSDFISENFLSFLTDSKRKRFVKYTKNGCCSNIRSEYVFTPEKRLLKVYEFEEDTKDPKKVTTIEREFIDYKWFSKTTTYPRELYFKNKK